MDKEEIARIEKLPMKERKKYCDEQGLRLNKSGTLDKRQFYGIHGNLSKAHEKVKQTRLERLKKEESIYDDSDSEDEILLKPSAQVKFVEEGEEKTLVKPVEKPQVERVERVKKPVEKVARQPSEKKYVINNYYTNPVEQPKKDVLGGIDRNELLKSFIKF